MNRIKKNSPAPTYRFKILEAFGYTFIALLLGQIVGGTFVYLKLISPDLEGISIILSFAIGLIITALILIKFKRLNIKKGLPSLFSPINFGTIALSIILYYASLPIAEFLSNLVPTDTPLLKEYYETIKQTFNIIFEHKAAAFITICLLAPILEEFIFRGIILTGLLNNKQINPWLSISITALIFGIAHGNPWQFLGAGFLGFIFGTIYWRTRNLALCILLHSLNNTMSFFISLYNGNIEEPVISPNPWIYILSFLCTIVALYYFLQQTKKTKPWN